MELRQRMARVSRFCDSHGLPPTLRARIRRFHALALGERDAGSGQPTTIALALPEDEKTVLAELPLYMAREVQMYLNRDIIWKVPLFKDASADFAVALVHRLVPQVALARRRMLSLVNFGEW